MTEYYKWCIYCTTDDKWEYLWSETAPTACPVNGAHAVTPNSVGKRATIRNPKKITAANSPFVVKHNAVHVCDCSDGSITITLPPASGKRTENRKMLFVKRGENNSCTLNASASETINGLSSKTLTINGSFAQITTTGNGDWQVQDDNDSTAQAALASSTANDDLWLFQEVYSKAVNAGTNVVNAWTTRKLNATVVDGGHEILLSNDELTIQAGTYEMKASSTFYGAGFTRIRLYCVTTNEEVLRGLNSYSQSSTTQHDASLQGFFRVDDTAKIYRLQYYTTKEQKNTGLGRAAGFDTNEVYTQVHIRKIVDN